MKKLYSSLIVIGALITFLPVAAMAAGGSGFPTWSSTFTKGRFTVLSLFGGDAVFDKETGLVWEQSPDTGTSSWYDALSHCNIQEIGGRKGWRLPTIEELASLVDTSQALLTLPAGHPFIAGSTFYWSATTDASNKDNAWGVNFGAGNVFVGGNKGSTTARAWCVRGGQGIDGVQ